jgi:hypothetical protein
MQGVNNSNSGITSPHFQHLMTILKGFNGKTSKLCDINSHIKVLPKLNMMKDRSERILKVEYPLNTPIGAM